jgi:hypothetical protein
MGFFDDLQSKASDLLGGSDIGGTVDDVSNNVQDATGGVQDMSADMQDQITQYAEEHNISIEAAREHFLNGGGN